jgi:hypothetical protein
LVTDAVRRIAFSADGRYMAVSSKDATVALRDLRTGGVKRLPADRAHHDDVWSLAFSNDSTLLASGVEAYLRASVLVLAPPRWVSRAGTEAIEALFAFETAFGLGAGVVRLTPDSSGLRAWLRSHLRTITKIKFSLVAIACLLVTWFAIHWNIFGPASRL